MLSVRLQYPDITGQMCLKMLTPAVSRVLERRHERPSAAKGLVVAHIDPAPACVGFTLGQNHLGRLITMQPLRRHDVIFDEAQYRIGRC